MVNSSNNIEIIDNVSYDPYMLKFLQQKCYLDEVTNGWPIGVVVSIIVLHFNVSYAIMGNSSNNIEIIGNVLYDPYMLKFLQQECYLVEVTRGWLMSP